MKFKACSSLIIPVLFISVMLFLGVSTVQADAVPVLTMSGGSTTFVEDSAAVAIDPSLTLVEPGASSINGATVSITGGYLNTEDRLVYATTAGISGSFNIASGILTLTGSATAADYQAALRAVQYHNINSASPNTGVRTIRYALGSSLSFSDNGHFYEFVSAPGMTWTAARDAAAARTLYGLQGYLATVTSANENSFIASKLAGQGWMGASDATVEGDWQWVTGPESGISFWSGLSNGNSVNGGYNNWGGGEPNNANNEDYAHFLNGGNWNDYPVSVGSNISGYVVEYGSMLGDPTTLQITGNKSINVTAQNDAPSFSSGATLSAINEDTLSPVGATISSLLNGNFNDVDASSSLSGIAVAADASVAGVEGDWEYSTDGGSTWFDMGAVSTSSALLLSSSTTLRFKPFANYSGTPGSLTVFSVDESGSTTYTNGSTRQAFDTTSDDLTSQASANGVSVGSSVSAVNDRPTLTNFTAVLDSSAGGIEIELTLAEFQAQADEADNEDGTVSRFVIKAVSSGSLKIGASSGTASIFSIGTNDTVDAANNAYWTPANSASGEVNAFTVVAEDSDNAESISAIQATVTVSSLPLVVYDFEDNTNDSSGNGNHGVLQGTIAYDSAGRSGKALSLSGSGYVELPYDLLRSNQDFTVSLWFKTTSTGGILGYQNAAAGTTSGNYVPIISINNLGQLQTELWIGSSMLVTSTNPVNDGQWHRVVMTADTTNNALNVYLDGMAIGSVTGAIQHLNMSFNQLGLNDSTLRTNINLPSTESNYFTGLLDEFTFYSNALPAAEIAKNTQSISFSAIADQLLSQDTLNLAATASSGLTVNYTSATTAVCTVTASTVTLLSTGICTIQANQVGDGIYSSAAQITRNFRVFNSLPPMLTMSSGSTTFMEKGAAVVIDPLLTIVEPSATVIDGATVAITGGYLSTEDRLVYIATAEISGSFDVATGILTLAGSATPEDYQAALRTVQYQNINNATPNTGVRTIRYALGSSLSFSENGHFYEFVSAPGMTWTAARDAAAARTLYGLQGYLATVTSVNESSFIASKLIGQGWMGASDAAVEGDWRWVTGPEAGTAFWSGVANGSAVGSEYNNWDSSQPDQWGSGEDYGQFLESGVWNDLPLSAAISGYVVEYGGMLGDSTLQITGNKSVSVVRVNDAPTGSVNMSGNLIEGFILMSDVSTIVDDDGLTAFSYQWQREGVDIIGATAANYVLTAADVGRAMTVTITYTDGGGSFESLSSVASAVIDGDLDGDSVGDATDIDIDGDGLTNAYEMANGLNKLDVSDRDVDSDNDGVSNYDEFVAGSNVNMDDYPPTLSVPADISVNAVGLYTAVDLGRASGLDANDGVVMTEVTHLNGEMIADMPTHFSPGAHVITWAASDMANNRVSAMQKINVMPLVEFSKNQVSTEGATASFSVILNGPAVNYPVTVPYTVSGTAMTDGSDHDLVDGSVIINSPDLVATVSFTLIDDGAGEGMETLLVTMGAPTNAVVGPVASHRVDIFEGNVVPMISLNADQGGNVTRFVSQADGQVVVTAAVTDANVGDVHLYDWSVTDNVLVDTDNDQATFSFDPTSLTPGLYTMNVSINDGFATVNEQLVLNIVASLPVLSVTDSDGDGVADATEGYGDSDGDGVPNYLDNSNMASNVVQQRASEIETFLMETEPGLMLSLGSVAFSAGEAQTGVSDSDIEQYGNAGTGAVADENYTFNGGLFDFNIEALPVPGQSVSVVVVQNIPISANAVYRKLMASGWQAFVEDSNNRLASAPGAEGYCPPPGDSSFSPGLTQGHWCVQLTIEDGGPNDADGRVNQTVQDPGGVAVLSSTPVNVKVTGSGGGGSVSLWAILLMGLIAVATRYNGRRLMLTLFCAVSSLGMAHAQSQLIPDYIAINYLSAKSDERTSDFQADIDNLGLSATVTQTDLSRSGWSSYIGYQFADNLALELGYVDLGESTTFLSGLAPDVDAFINSAEKVYPVTGSGWTFNFIGRAPLGKKVDFLLNFGAFLWQAEYDLSSGTISKTFEEDGFDITLGFGLEMDVVAQFPVRLGWTKYRFGGADVNAWSLGLGYRF